MPLRLVVISANLCCDSRERKYALRYVGAGCIIPTKINPSTNSNRNLWRLPKELEDVSRWKICDGTLTCNVSTYVLHLPGIRKLYFQNRNVPFRPGASTIITYVPSSGIWPKVSWMVVDGCSMSESLRWLLLYTLIEEVMREYLFCNADAG